MPEGDTIRRLAAVMKPLIGATVEEVRLRDRGLVRSLGGSTIRDVRSVGKHLIVELSGDWAIRVHLGMKGRWRRYRPDRLPPSSEFASVVLRTQEEALVCTRASQTELLRASALGRAPALARLGPDLLADDFSLDEVLERVRRPETGGRAVGEVLLDQRVAAGIGNVYKSEVLFLCHVDPWAALDSLDDDTLGALYECARKLMRANLGSGRRATRPANPRSARPGSEPRLWVYGRARRPCARPSCGGIVVARGQGEQARTTYYCPRCQRGEHV